MVQLAISSLLFGAVFGLRFRVLVLLPLSFASGLVAVVFGLLTRQTPGECLATIAACTLALQGGYVFGSMARFTLAAARSPRLPARQFTAAPEIHSR